MKHLSISIQAGTAAATLLRESYASNAGIESSIAKDIKTQADVAAQELILKHLASTGIPVLAEEGEQPEAALSGLRWLVDPLDGTLNFTRGFPMACVSIALWQDLHPMVGVIVDVFTGQVFSGEVGKGAHLDSLPIRVSQVADPAQAVIATGFPSGRTYDEPSLLEFVAKVRKYKKVRMLGSAALMLAQVAAGRFEVYEEEDIYLWDVAAGLALIKASGGNFQLTPGSSPTQFHVRASNGKI